jgi:type I restriction enzyme S subunit
MSNKEKSSSKKIAVQPTLTPKLRFLAFRNAEAWMLQRLAPYLNDCSGRVPSDTLLPVYSSTREGLKRQDVYFDGRLLQNNSDYGLVPPGCFVYRHMSDDGSFKFNINDTGGDIAVSKEYPVFKTNNLNARFLLEKLNEGPDFKQFAFSQKAGGTRTRLYFSRLREWQTFLPQLPEQQKIAECLDSSDALIAAQGRKVAALRAHKKGLMQQLFPQEGETQPRLRFPEFRDAGEWGSKTLTEVATYENGKAYEQDIVENGKYIVVNSRFISTEGAVRKYTNADYLTANTGDVLMVLSDLPRGRALAKCYFVEPDNRYAVNQRVCRLKGKRVDPKFLFFILDRNSNLLAYDDGQNQTHLSKDSVLECPLCIPPTKDEQKRIADCLTSLDDLIAAETRKLDTLKTHKKGLMQQLFPQVGETDA